MDIKMLTGKTLSGAMLALCALALSGQALADTESACRLRGGSLVPLPAEACAKEGGTMVTVTITAPAAAAPGAAPAAAASAPVAAPVQLSADPRRAAAQQAILALLAKPVISGAAHRYGPEGVARTAKFDECTLTVNEEMNLDYGNLISARLVFKIDSTVDFRALQDKQFGVLGKTYSKGGDLEAYSVYLKRPVDEDAKAFSISVALRDGENLRKYRSPDAEPYWSGPYDDFWMADRYGYPKGTDEGKIYTNRTRILYIVPTADDAAALKKAFGEMQAACRP